MAAPSLSRPASFRESPFLFLLLILFAGSGCSALIYEIVWFQMLQLAIGSTSVSMGFLLAAYMGGLCLGSMLLPRMKKLPSHPLRTYGFIELGIAAMGLLVLVLMPLVERVYLSAAILGVPGLLLRGFIAGVCLLPPTMLMGASLPAAARWIGSSSRGAAWWGLLYGTNTVGAVFGCLWAGFHLLRLYDVKAATLVAAALNVAVGLGALAIASRTPVKAAIEEEPASAEPAAPAPAANEPETAERRSTLRLIYITIGLSGACALGAEVVWTRLLGYLFGLTTYVFSIILAVFLIGLAAGSTVGSWMARGKTAEWSRVALGWCQVLLAGTTYWAAVMIADSLPYWPVNPMMTDNPWFIFQVDMARSLWALLPPTLLWGASFPLALAATAAPGRDSGKLVGSVYAANTLGAIFGSLIVSLTLIPAIGTLQTQRLLLLLSAVTGLVILAPYARQRRSMATAACVTGAMVFAVFISTKVHEVPWELIAFGRKISTSIGHAKLLHKAEGRNSSVVISQWEDGALQIDVNGHVEATNEPYDMRLQRMVGHLAALLNPNAKSVLGIGFGAGVSAGTFTRYPNIQKIKVCEIEPVIPPISTQYFGAQNYRVMLDPRTTIQYDDARHYLRTTSEKFDIIASDPLDVFAKGTAALYSLEYFESVKAHLNPGGVFTLYVPLYESDTDTVRSELATFFAAFPNGTIWTNTIDGQGYDMVFMGHLEAPKIDLDAMESRLSQPAWAPVRESLSDIQYFSVAELYGTYAGRKSDMAAWLQGAELNLDSNLRLMYMAGWGINSNRADPINREIMKLRQFPTDMFSGSPDKMQSLRYAMGVR
jgi:spermidine synthase